MIGAAVAALTMASCLPAPAQEPPQRVVSTNLCTDQLAMLIAAPGQLHSVSFLASDPEASVLTGEAGRFAVNHGQAEEVFRMRPDLVVAGSYSIRTTVSLLRRLGVRVEQFTPETSIADIRANLTRMGDLLGRQERAAELVAAFDKDLQQLSAHPPPAMTVALYDSNSYSFGAGTLTDAAVKAAGLINIGDRLGLKGGARLPLELLLAARPDLVVTGESRYEAPALAQENFHHPAFEALLESARHAFIPSKYTLCGGPFTLEAVRMLQAAARRAAAANP